MKKIATFRYETGNQTGNPADNKTPTKSRSPTQFICDVDTSNVRWKFH